MVTIKNIAEYTNFSVSTVSLALRDDPRIKERTRHMIQKLAKEIDYVPSSYARALQSGKSHLLGYLLINLNTSFFYRLLGAASLAAADDDYAIISSCCNSAEIERKQLKIMRQKGIDGLIVSGCYRENLPYLEQLSSQGCHIVGCSWFNASPQYPNVITDNQLGGKIAGEYLISCGHTHIVFTAFKPCIIEERFQGLLDAALPHPEVRIERTFGREQVEQLLKRPHNHIAFFAHSDEEALELIDVLNDANLQVPQDVSVVGFDDMQFLKINNNLKLTTVAQRQDELGKYAYLALQCIAKQRPISQLLIPPLLCIRDSVRMFR